MQAHPHQSNHKLHPSPFCCPLQSTALSCIGQLFSQPITGHNITSSAQNGPISPLLFSQPITSHSVITGSAQNRPHFLTKPNHNPLPVIFCWLNPRRRDHFTTTNHRSHKYMYENNNVSCLKYCSDRLLRLNTR